MKRLINTLTAIVFSTALLMPCFATPALATTTLENQKTIPSNINELSKKFHVNADELRAEILKEADSPVFSPFSEIKSNYGVNAYSKTDSNTGLVTPNDIYYSYFYNQNSTAYLATGQRTASGVWPAVGMCAVHHYSNGTPYIPFGTDVYLTSGSVTIQGTSYTKFNVQDTGDPNFIQSANWLDLFFGSNTSENQTAALNYGNRLIDYYYYQVY